MNPFDREVHLAVDHEADETLLERLDSREARDLHRWKHSIQGQPADHDHLEGEW